MYSTSRDSINWTVHHTINLTIGITDVIIDLGAGTYTGNSSSTGEARFDEFELCGP